VTEKLNELAQQRAEVERGLLEMEQRLAGLSGRGAAGSGPDPPGLRLPLALRVTGVDATGATASESVRERDCPGEINASVAPGLVGMPGETVKGKMVRRIQNWLPIPA